MKARWENWTESRARLRSRARHRAGHRDQARRGGSPARHQRSRHRAGRGDLSAHRAAGGQRGLPVIGSVTDPAFGERFVKPRWIEYGRHRHHRQQRGLYMGQRCTKDDRRAVVRHDRRPSDRAVPDSAGRGPVSPRRRQGRAGQREPGDPQGRQHLLDRGTGRQCWPGRLRLGQGRH